MYRFRPRVFELGDREVFELARRLARHRAPVMLDSAKGRPHRWSLLGFDPLPPRAPQTLFAPRELLAHLCLETGDPIPGPFHGGFLGAFAYDLGVHAERPLRCAPEPFGFPLVVGGLYVDFVVRDEQRRQTWLVLGEEPGDGRDAIERRRAQLEAEFDRTPAMGVLRADEVVRCVTSAEHRARIQRCREHITQGTLYQANLAHRFTCDAEGAPLDWYTRLRHVNPAPFMGFASWETGALLSASPELLFEFDGRVARTRPIKGTSPRSSDPSEDEHRKRALLASTKDRAELAMIVDLERNDLGRVARSGAVWVEGFPTLESYARVHHTTADVVAEVRPGLDACDLLAALFPGGSVTGAPKLSAMDVIAELEREGRGFFCGSLGFVDTRGHAAFNILIRTLLWRPRTASHTSSVGEFSFRVGGGITWSSDPDAEDRETLDKAAGLIDALHP